MSYGRDVKKKVNLISRIIYDQIETETRTKTQKRIHLNHKSLKQAIYELKHPSDPRLTPLTDAEIDQDLHDLGWD